MKENNNKIGTKGYACQMFITKSEFKGRIVFKFAELNEAAEVSQA
jgi:hypothetical protein